MNIGWHWWPYFQHVTFQRCEQGWRKMASLPRDTGQIIMFRFADRHCPIHGFYVLIQSSKCLWKRCKLPIWLIKPYLPYPNNVCCPYDNSHRKLLHLRRFTFSCLLLVLFHLQLIAAQGNDALDKMKKKYLSAMFTKEMKTHRVYVYFLNIPVHLDILTGCGYIQQMMLRKKHIAGQLLS